MTIQPFSSELEAAYHFSLIQGRNSSILPKVEIEGKGHKKFLNLSHESLIACISPKSETPEVDPGVFKAIREVTLFSVKKDGKVKQLREEYLLYKFKNSKLIIYNSDELNSDLLKEAAHTDLFHNQPEILQIVAKASYMNSKGVEKVVLIVPKQKYSLQKVRQKNLPLSREIFVTSLLQGMHLIHKEKMIHRDIKPENLLVSSEGKCVIADFGSATLKQNNRIVGSPDYYAPEEATAIRACELWEQENPGVSRSLRPDHIQQALERSVSIESDCFRLGKVLYHMREKEDGFPKDLFSRLKNRDEKIEASAALLSMSPLETNYSFFCKKPTEILSYKDLVQGLLQADPKQRLTMEKAIDAWVRINGRPDPQSCTEDGK